MGLEKQKKIIEDPSYQEKANPQLREADKKKMADLETEKRGFEETLKQFETLKLE